MDGPPGLHLIVEEGSINSLSRLSSACFFLFVHSGRGRQPTYMKRRRGGFLDIKVSRRSKKATSGSNRCFGHSVDSSVLAVMLAKAGVSAGFTYYWI